MELSFGSTVSVALLACLLYLSVLTSPASAKCRGKWAIHACFGGNGKRSDPSLDMSAKQPSTLLEKLLSDRADRILEERMAPPAYVDEEEVFGERDTDDYPAPRELSKANTLQQLRSLIRAVRMSQNLRQNEDLI